MAFSEPIKKEVKERAAFRCCICQEIGSIEAHHIIPQEYDGPDTLENAAPLCPSCHAKYGDNPKKRKEITQMRDWWYKKVEGMFPDNKESFKLLEQVNSKLDNLQNNNSQLVELKESLKELADITINKMTVGTAAVTASGIANASLASISSTKLGDKVHANFICHRCGTSIGLLVGSNSCPNCGQQF